MNDTITVLDNPITAQDLRALRHADSIVFRLYKGQATIEANRDGRSTPTGFDDKHVIYVGGAHVTDHNRESGTWVTKAEHHRYSGFVMFHSGVKYNNRARTLVDTIKVGSTCSLHWSRSNNTENLRGVAFHADELELHVTRKSGQKTVTDAYLVDYSVGPDNSARMVKVDWNGV